MLHGDDFRRNNFVLKINVKEIKRPKKAFRWGVEKRKKGEWRCGNKVTAADKAS